MVRRKTPDSFNEHEVEIDIMDRDAPTIRSSDTTVDDPLYDKVKIRKSKMNMLAEYVLLDGGFV